MALHPLVNAAARLVARRALVRDHGRTAHAASAEVAVVSADDLAEAMSDAGVSLPGLPVGGFGDGAILAWIAAHSDQILKLAQLIVSIVLALAAEPPSAPGAGN